MKLFKRKKLVVPTEETKEIDAVKTWRVTWESYGSSFGYSSALVNKECEFFTSIEEAEEFRHRLQDAIKLMKNEPQKIKITENN